MPKKWTGQNSKAAEANERKAAVKRDAQAEKERQKEDAKWADDDKHNAAKEARRKEAEEKRLKAVQRKAENKEIEQKERAELTKQYGNKGVQKVTQAEIAKTKEKEEKEKKKAEEQKKKEEEEPELERNINHVIREQNKEMMQSGTAFVDARSVEEAIDGLVVSDSDRNPEKRMRAAFALYEQEHLDRMRKENPKLKLTQVREMLWKQWQKAPENPFNQ
eukprot:TRINITY_DN6056_c0_g1_i2.p1 TRINITY_DN6056_c0_g1~~TRINITY_DN6056_c0_g1_i2.p1  ORF type:complete len:219 (-),score=89.10 TRINITY_DN6056_c0_g1_i2:110-766(-)